MQLWTITRMTTGAVIEPCFATKDAAVHPSQAGFAWAASEHKATKIPARPDPLVQRWDGSSWIEDAAKVEALLLVAIDAERETRQMVVLTTGGAKKYVYNRKSSEAYDARTVLPATLNALGIADRKKRFPFAAAEAALTGEAISAVLTRFDAGMTAAATEDARIEAVAQKAKRDVRAAATAAAKRAAVAAINWSWTG